MGDAIHNCIRNRGVFNVCMPVFHRHLAGDDSRAASYPVIQHFQKVAPPDRSEGCKAEIIEDKEIRFGELIALFRRVS